ncbi:MAG: sufS [Chitinophagaceae bacterium]|nr:sufS [Chitinophagaceae bacterium]
MSINTSSNGLPDTEALEKLANELFAALPGGFTSALVPEQVTKLQRYDALGNQNDPFNVKEPQTSLPDPHFTNAQVPKSVGGSGISPSAVTNGNVFQAKDHQLPDAQLAGTGRIPQSLGGVGISPSVVPQELKHEDIPYASEQPFDLGNMNPLGSLSAYNSVPQIPVSSVAPLPTSQFYFLSENPSIHFGEELFTASSKPFSQESKHGIIGNPSIDFNLVKKDFPILQERVNGKPLIWLDNAATTQKPKSVIDRLTYFYEHENSNIHRAAHELAARATDAYEEARKKVQTFINAGSTNEIVFVRGTTEAINLVAKSWGEQYLRAGDEIIISHLEHHANIVPWQQLAAKKDLKIKVIPVDDDGQILLDEYAKLLSTRTKLVSFTQVSNALGTITPAKQMVAMAQQAGAKVLVDGAQSVSHMRADVRDLNCDWFVFSGHKVFGPTGIGVLYGKEELLNATQPWQGGGNMIKDVTFEHTEYHDAPGRFEAGTGNIADAVGLGAAIDYVNRYGIEAISQYEHYLLVYATGLLKQVPGLRLIGTAKDKASVLSFVLDGFRTEEVGAALNKEGIAVRSGHHCAQPILRRFGLEATVRPSLAFYNTCSDIDVLVDTLHRLKKGQLNRLIQVIK